jgi:LacI family sucrose operon transcriptional repressor
MATIKDVAEKAGISVTTVSRVLNNRGYISEKTRQKVYAIMEELHYQPNEIARSLLRKQSYVIGLIIPSVAHPFFGEFTDVVEHYAYEYGYKLLLCHSQLDPNKEREYIGMMKRHRVDGIIMGSHTLEVEEYWELNYPVVTVDRRIHDFPYVASDNLQGGRIAAQTLIEKGCRKIAHICGNRSLDMLANLRTSGFKEEMERAGMEPIILETNMDVFNQDEYKRIVSDMFTQYPDVDGVFTTSDIMASYVIKHCISSGKKIPEEIKIVGYDDVAAAAWISPGITTIKQPILDMGKMAVELIHKQINGGSIEKENIFPVELVIRETT